MRILYQSLYIMAKMSFFLVFYQTLLSQRQEAVGEHPSLLEQEEVEFILYRAIGNDLPPRHASGQSYTNVKFILENENELPVRDTVTRPTFLFNNYFRNYFNCTDHTKHGK